MVSFANHRPPFKTQAKCYQEKHAHGEIEAGVWADL